MRPGLDYKLSKLFFYVGGLALLLNTFIAIGDEDEADHCHAAWLMGKAHLVPVRDFFQNHQSFLWDLLKHYYIWGGNGLGVFYFGRALVCLSVAAVLVSVTLIARGDSDSRRMLYPGVISVLLLIAAEKLLPTAFVIRPEGVAAGFALASLCLWTRRRSVASLSLLLDIAAGSFLGLAVSASVRFATLAGIYVLLLEGERRAPRNDLKRLLALFMAAFATAIAYLQICQSSFRYLAFDIGFSAHLQHVGSTPYSATRQMTELLAFVSVVAFCLYWLLNEQFRRRYLLLLSWCALSVLAAIYSWGDFPFEQNAIVPLLLAVVAIAWAESHLEMNDLVCRAAIVAAGCIVVLFLAVITRHTLKHQLLFDAVRRREQILAHVRPGDTVLLSSEHHPINVADFSYFGLHLAYPNICPALSTYQTSLRIPDCGYVDGTRKTAPVLIDVEEFANDPSLHDQEWKSTFEMFGASYRALDKGFYVRTDR